MDAERIGGDGAPTSISTDFGRGREGKGREGKGRVILVIADLFLHNLQ
jgi:hypothetical protein